MKEERNNKKIKIVKTALSPGHCFSIRKGDEDAVCTPAFKLGRRGASSTLVFFLSRSDSFSPSLSPPGSLVFPFSLPGCGILWDSLAPSSPGLDSVFLHLFHLRGYKRGGYFFHLFHLRGYKRDTAGIPYLFLPLAFQGCLWPSPILPFPRLAIAFWSDPFHLPAGHTPSIAYSQLGQGSLSKSWPSPPRCPLHIGELGPQLSIVWVGRIGLNARSLLPTKITFYYSLLLNLSKQSFINGEKAL